MQANNLSPNRIVIMEHGPHVARFDIFLKLFYKTKENLHACSRLRTILLLTPVRLEFIAGVMPTWKRLIRVARIHPSINEYPSTSVQYHTSTSHGVQDRNHY